MSDLFPKNFIIQRNAFDWYVIGIEDGIATLLLRTDIFAGSLSLYFLKFYVILSLMKIFRKEDIVQWIR